MRYGDETLHTADLASPSALRPTTTTQVGIGLWGLPTCVGGSCGETSAIYSQSKPLKVAQSRSSRMGTDVDKRHGHWSLENKLFQEVMDRRSQSWLTQSVGGSTRESQLEVYT